MDFAMVWQITTMITENHTAPFRGKMARNTEGLNFSVLTGRLIKNCLILMASFTAQVTGTTQMEALDRLRIIN